MLEGYRRVVGRLASVPLLLSMLSKQPIDKVYKGMANFD